jgi:transcription elongation factor Elf1
LQVTKQRGKLVYNWKWEIHLLCWGGGSAMLVKSIVFMSIMSATLLWWMIWNVVHCNRTIKAIISKDGFIMRVECKKCGMEYEVPVEEFLKRNFSRQRLGGTNVQMRGPVMISEEKVVSMSKKFDCPGCGRREWAKILNIDEYYDRYRNLDIRIVLKQLLFAFCGGAVLFFIFDVVSKIMHI